MTTYPVISLKPSYNSVIRGCPGLPETLPRIECQLQIRSNNGKAFKFEKLDIKFLTVETLHQSSFVSNAASNIYNDINRSGNASNIKSEKKHHHHNPFHHDENDDSILSLPKIKKNKLDVCTVHYKRTVTLKHNRSNKNNKIIGIDIPLTIALPDDIKDTNFNSKFGNCVSLLDCKIYYDNHSRTFQQFINVERYSFLPSSLLFPSFEKQMLSSDQRFIVTYKLENPCVCNNDLLKLRIILKSNPKSNSKNNTNIIFNKKNKLKSIIFQLKEILEINNCSSNGKHENIGNNSNGNSNNSSKNDNIENILQVFTKEINQVISLNEIKISVDIRIFTKDKHFHDFESIIQEPEFLYKLPKHINRTRTSAINNNSIKNKDIKTLLLQNKNDNIPFQYHTSITTLGYLFNITHRLCLKFKISNGKDFELNQNITVTKWSKAQLKYIQQLIVQEKETAYFAKKFYMNFGGISKRRLSEMDYVLEYPNLPPVVYDYNFETLKKFNIQYDLNHKNPIRIPIIE